MKEDVQTWIDNLNWAMDSAGRRMKEIESETDVELDSTLKNLFLGAYFAGMNDMYDKIKGDLNGKETV